MKRPPDGRPGPVNAERSRRARERLDDMRTWRYYLSSGERNRSPDESTGTDGEEDEPRGWVP